MLSAIFWSSILPISVTARLWRMCAAVLSTVRRVSRLQVRLRVRRVRLSVSVNRRSRAIYKPRRQSFYRLRPGRFFVIVPFGTVNRCPVGHHAWVGLITRDTCARCATVSRAMSKSMSCRTSPSRNPAGRDGKSVSVRVRSGRCAGRRVSVGCDPAGCAGWRVSVRTPI